MWPIHGQTRPPCQAATVAAWQDARDRERAVRARLQTAERAHVAALAAFIHAVADTNTPADPITQWEAQAALPDLREAVSAARAEESRAKGAHRYAHLDLERAQDALDDMTEITSHRPNLQGW